MFVVARICSAKFFQIYDQMRFTNTIKSKNHIYLSVSTHKVVVFTYLFRKVSSMCRCKIYRYTSLAFPTCTCKYGFKKLVCLFSTRLVSALSSRRKKTNKQTTTATTTIPFLSVRNSSSCLNRSCLFCRGKCMLVILQRKLYPAPRTCSSI